MNWTSFVEVWIVVGIMVLLVTYIVCLAYCCEYLERRGYISSAALAAVLGSALGISIFVGLI